jgi:hypothetical protein
MEFFSEEFIGSIYLSNLNIIPFNLEMVLMVPVASLRSPKIIKSLSVIALLPRPSLSESLFKSYKS